MRVAIVGNGPSAKGQGAAIDACDRVVRCNRWFETAAEDAGQRTDASALYGNDSLRHGLSDAEAVAEAECFAKILPPACEVWLTLPLSRCRPFYPEHCGSIFAARAMAGLRPIRWVSESMWVAEQHLLTRRRGSWAAPSTGFTAIDMALAIWQPAELFLAGFDATEPTAPGWNDARGEAWPLALALGHDLGGEKAVIRELNDKHTWLGNPLTVKIEWTALA